VARGLVGQQFEHVEAQRVSHYVHGVADDGVIRVQDRAPLDLQLAVGQFWEGIEMHIP